jgi:hypothetical protein
MSSEIEKVEQSIFEVEINTPIDLRPDLSMYGIEEVDRGVCADTYENRSVLRVSKLNWITIYDERGQPTGNIQVISREMKSFASQASAEDRRIILTDPKNLNSDYITEEALLIEEKADFLIPLWVIQATKTWNRVREARLEDPGKMPSLGGPPSRCRAIKADGHRCLLWATGRMTDDGLCRTHLGTKAPQINGAAARARERVHQAAPKAVEILEQLMESAESEPVKLKAATEILDRAGVRGGIEIDGKFEVEVRPAAELILERLNRLRPSDPEYTILQPTLERIKDAEIEYDSDGVTDEDQEPESNNEDDD